MQQPTDFKLQPTPAFLNTVENDTARECCCSRASPNACLGISLCRYAGFRTRGVTRRSRSTPWGVMRTSSGCSSGVVHGESERGIRGNLATATLLQFFPIVEYVYARAQVPLLGAPVIRQAQRSVRCGPGPGVAPKSFCFLALVSIPSDYLSFTRAEGGAVPFRDALYRNTTARPAGRLSGASMRSVILRVNSSGKVGLLHKVPMLGHQVVV